MASASTFTEETAEQARVLSAYMTREFQYVSLAAEGSVSTARPEPDWEQALANKMLKREMRIKRLGSAKPPAVRISPPQSPGSSELHRLSHPVLEDFAPWHCESDDPRIGPDLADAAQAARTFYVLPRGRVYCNVRFSLLQSHDKITYTWITPSGRRFYRKTLVKVLAQKQTWSWNYIDLSEDRAQSQTGRWAVKVTVNGRRVLQASFNVLNDWIDVRPGILPIILLCPHGGRVVPAQCASRLQEQGEDLGCADTVEVVRNLASHLEYMFQVAPTVVYCKIHRRWLDVDAKEQDAYADSKMAPYYHAFYDALLACIRHTMTLQRRVPFILNLRAHHDFNQVVYASTLDGQTLWGMLERGECGDPRFANEGVNSRLAAAYQVIPANHHQRDDVTYGAGNLVRTFGRDHPWHADAIDVICPKTMCRGFGLRPLTRDIAESLGSMYVTFVHDEFAFPPGTTPLQFDEEDSQQQDGIEEERLHPSESEIAEHVKFLGLQGLSRAVDAQYTSGGEADTIALARFDHLGRAIRDTLSSLGSPDTLSSLGSPRAKPPRN